jgi:hypothetical protein
VEDEQADDEIDLKLIDLANDADNKKSVSEDPKGGHSDVDIEDELTEVEGVIREQIPEMVKLAWPFQHVLHKVSTYETSDKLQLTIHLLALTITTL